MAPGPLNSSDSNPRAEPSKPLIIQKPAQVPKPTQCTKCLGLGHSRKDCTGSLRSKIFSNYSHVSFICLSNPGFNAVIGLFPIRKVKRHRICIYTLLHLPPLTPSSPLCPPPRHLQQAKPQPLLINGKLGGRSVPSRPTGLLIGRPHAPSATPP